jgi:hypothetical protein
MNEKNLIPFQNKTDIKVMNGKLNLLIGLFGIQIIGMFYTILSIL